MVSLGSLQRVENQTMYQSYHTGLSALLVAITLTGCSSLPGNVPIKVDDSGTIYSGSVTFGIGRHRKSSLNENHHLDLELSHLYTSGHSSQTLTTGQYIWGRSGSISGPAVLDQNWRYQKTDVAVKYSRALDTESAEGSMLFFSGMAGLSRAEQSISMVDQVSAQTASYYDVELSPMVGLGIGYQFNEVLSVNFDGRYSLSWFEENETIQTRIYMTGKPAKNIKLELGYQFIQSEDDWDLEMELEGPWFSVGMDIR